MFVEHLHYRVSAAQVAAFVAHNRRWRAALARQPGFIRQMTYRGADDPTAWLVVVHWRERADMAAFPQAAQAVLEEAGRGLAMLERTEFYGEYEA